MIALKTIRRAAVWSLVWQAVVAAGARIQADELPKAEATVPNGFVEVRRDLGGTYYVDRAIKKRYDDLFAEIQTLQADVQQARIDEGEARRRIAHLRIEIKEALAQIHDKEVFVSPAIVHKRRNSQSFELGPGGTLLVKADQVQIVGWDEPHVEVLIEKIVLSADNQPAGDELDAIKLVKRTATPASVLGRGSREQMDEALLKLTPETLAKQSFMWSTYRSHLRAAPEVAAHLDPTLMAVLQPKETLSPLERMSQRMPFESYLYKDVEVIEIDGLTYERGNRSIELDIKGKLHGSSSSVWRRHARLTVYAPHCQQIAVLGGSEGIEINSVHAAVELSMSNVPSRDAVFRVKDLQGTLVSRDVPLQLVDKVTGDVDVVHVQHATITSGPHHDNVKGVVSAKLDKPNVYRAIAGQMHGWFVQSNLQLESLCGPVDVRNDFGDTSWILAQPPAQTAHRIVSESGNLQIQLAKADLALPSVMALSQVGNVNVASDLKLESVQFSVWGDYNLAPSWHGFLSELDDKKNPTATLLRFQRFSRVEQILHDSPRDAGLDLISRAGSIRILVGSSVAD